MAIPDWDWNGLIPPIRPGTAEDEETNPFTRSPYEVDLEQLVERFLTTTERSVLIRGFLDYRAALHQIGITTGFQWVNGSFVEEVEDWEENPHSPNDIDVVTFYYPPAAEEWQVLPLFYAEETKSRFHVDAQGIRLGIPLTEGIVADIAYYYGLWSHRRKDRAWKGFVQVDLSPGLDDLARQILENECRRMGWT